MAAPTYVGPGIASAGVGVGIPTWPAHEAEDVALLIVETCGGEPVTLSTPAGFVAVANSPQATGTTTNGTQLSVFWCRATSSSMGNPTIADPGDHQQGRIVTFRDCVRTGDPWDVTAGDVKPAASTSVTFPDVTTTVDECLVVHIATRDTDTGASDFSAFTNGALTGLAERLDTGTTQGNGGGYAVATGVKATAGVVGSTSATVVSAITAHMTIALKPPLPAAPAFVAKGTALAAVSGGNVSWPTHAVDDIGLLVLETCGGEPVTLTTPSGFTAVTDSPQATGTTTNGTQLSVYWCRATSTSMADVVVADPGDHLYGMIFTYRGCIGTGDPWDDTEGSVKAAADAVATFPAVTTTTDECLIVGFGSHDLDVSSAAFSSFSPASAVEDHDAGTTIGNGGGIVAWHRTKGAAGSTGTTTATVSSSINAYLTLALKPLSSGATGTGTGLAVDAVLGSAAGYLDAQGTGTGQAVSAALGDASGFLGAVGTGTGQSVTAALGDGTGAVSASGAGTGLAVSAVLGSGVGTIATSGTGADLTSTATLGSGAGYVTATGTGVGLLVDAVLGAGISDAPTGQGNPLLVSAGLGSGTGFVTAFGAGSGVLVTAALGLGVAPVDTSGYRDIHLTARRGPDTWSASTVSDPWHATQPTGGWSARRGA